MLFLLVVVTVVVCVGSDAPSAKRARTDDFYDGPSREFWEDVTKDQFDLGVMTLLGLEGSPSVTFDGVLGYFNGTAVYAINTTRWAIKYKAFTVSDSLIREAEMLQRVNALCPEITHEFLYRSRDALEVNSSGKLKLRRSHRRYLVSYLITERVGMSLHDLMDRYSRFPVGHAAAIGLQVLRNVRKLHTVGGVIHRDIHLGNVAVSSKTPRKLILLDFGLSEVFTGPTEDTQREYAAIESTWNAYWCHGMISPWETRSNFYTSFRDDVFRVVKLIAVLMHGHEYLEDVQAVCGPEDSAVGTRDEILHFLAIQDRLHLFDLDVKLPGGILRPYRLNRTARTERLPQEKFRRVHELLWDLQVLARLPSDPWVVPDYSGMETILEEIVRVAAGPFPGGVDVAHIDFT
jgi:serine/threonine protein kinase